MFRVVILLFLFMTFPLFSESKIENNTNNKIYVLNYIKNKFLNKKIEKFYKSFNDKFVNANVVYVSPENDSFYQDFRTYGLSFLNTFMIKENYNVVLIFYQKKEKRKISIISQKRKVNATRSSNISSKKLPKEIIYEKIISKSLQDLGELLIIKAENRVL